MEIRVLGPIELVGSAGDVIALPGNKMRGLVAVLALEAGHTVTAQRIIDALWGEQEVSGPNVVQVVVSKLRRVLSEASEPNCVTTKPAGYQLDLDAGDIDVRRFEGLVEEARIIAGDPSQSAALLERGLALWHGVPLWGAPDTDVIAAIRSAARRAAQCGGR